MDVQYQGSWISSGNGSISIRANETPSVTIKPPLGTNYFTMNGNVGPQYGLYSVTIQPPPPFPRTISTYNATNARTWDGVRLFFNSLDPDVQYTIKITGDEDPTKFIGLHDWTYCLYSET